MQLHIPVLPEAFLRFFSFDRPFVLLDATLGLGGHAALALEAFPQLQKLIGIDQDADARQKAAALLKTFGDRSHILAGNFSQLDSLLDREDYGQLDAIFIDLGLSSLQLDSLDRGFSFSREAVLDMRMNTSSSLMAKDIIASWSREDLETLFREYGEERQWRRAARAIVIARKIKKIETVNDLKEILMPVLFRHRKHHPLTLIFQALRLAVNQELEVLKEVLPQALKRLKPQGRLGIISFHSLEDRIVKNFFREYSHEIPQQPVMDPGVVARPAFLKCLHKGVITASPEEQKSNPRSRSAKFRVVEKLDYPCV